MYKIIGADQREYGPVTVEQIREWIAEGRVNRQTRVQAEGRGEWRPLTEFPELVGSLTGTITGAPVPPLPATAASTPARTSGLAIASLVLGILGFCTFGLTALLGLILGIVALARINRSNGAMKGWGVALAGTVVSGVFLLMLPILAGLLLPALAKAKNKATAITCMNNLRQLGLAARMYAGEYNELLPSAANWCDGLQQYVASGKSFQCPLGDQSQRCHFGFNAQLSGADLSKIEFPVTTVLFFETDGGWNVSGGREMVLTRPRHPRTVAMGFVDGHVELVNVSRLENVRWKP
jgi:prepilin-type processing-associated H-X9-DG protein